MKTGRWFCLGGAFILLTVCVLGGCMGNYGTIRVATGKWGTTIGELEENWENYDTYYAGLSYKSPSAIMFDPKNDGKRLIGIKWMPVTEKSVAVTIIEWLDSYVNFPPTLWKILGPNGEFFGYIYTSAIEQVVIEQIDPDTLKIENIPLPPIDYGGGSGWQG